MKKLIKTVKNLNENEKRELALFMKMPRTIIDRKTGNQVYKA